MPFLNEFTEDSINLESIYDKYPDEQFLILDNLDKAILGVEDDKMVIVYSTKKILSILMEEDEMSYEDAMEHFSFNIKGAYLGEKTPIYIDDIF